VLAFLMAVTASAAIVYSTNGSGTGFVTPTTGLTLNQSSGTASATLTFTPNISGSSGVPSSIDLGDFRLVCPGCSTQGDGTASSIFGSFTFDLQISDTTDGATGTFHGTSTGGTIWSDVSNISLTWSPLQLGPGTSNAETGDFGTTFFTKQLNTYIVAPNSGTPAVDTTLQGYVDSTPEPATFSLIGGALLGLAFLRRKKLSRS